tara:strand:+ start:64 stop:978 length:915 start_codon:yes stop_codon:yes gene_type:complete
MDNSDWYKHINSLIPKTKDNVSKKNLFEALKKSVMDSIPSEPFGILLSGGVDSTLIAKICKDYGADFRCFCVGIKGSADVESAKIAAEELELNLVLKEYEINEIEELLMKSINILPIPEIHNDNYIEYMVKISVSAVLLAALNLGNEKVFLSGIGAEELFAGYHRHSLSTDKGGKWRGNQIKELEEESWDGIKRLEDLVIIRDEMVSKSVKKQIVSPYINDELIILAMSLPSIQKIDSQTNKKILREIAMEIGIPRIISERKKKGAQYGSGFDKAITKLAKKNGFKLKKRYIDSLLKNRKNESE